MKIIVDADEVTVDPTGRPGRRAGQAIAARNAAASGQHGGVIRGKREQITLTMPRELLVAVDMLARRMGQTRTALINRAIYELLQQNKAGAAPSARHWSRLSNAVDAPCHASINRRIVRAKARATASCRT